MTAQAYEVQLKVVDEPKAKARSVTRTEYAYSVLDAVQQAIFNQGA